MDTPDEIKANEAHLKKLREDPEYRIEFVKSCIYGDAEEFIEFCAAHGITEQVLELLLVALRTSVRSGLNPDGKKAEAILSSVHQARVMIDEVIERVVEATNVPG